MGLFNRLSQCQFANGFSQEKEKKMFLAFGCETSQLLLSKQIIARNLELVSMELNHLVAIMAVRVVEFSNEVYKIRKIFA